jgi:hypothetical protein
MHHPYQQADQIQTVTPLSFERTVVPLPQRQEEPTMEYLVTMTTHVPDGTPDQAVDDVRARVG